MRYRIEKYKQAHHVFSVHMDRRLTAEECTNPVAVDFSIQRQRALPQLLQDMLEIPGVAAVRTSKYVVHVSTGKAFTAQDVVAVIRSVVHRLVRQLSTPDEKITCGRTITNKKAPPAMLVLFQMSDDDDYEDDQYC